MKTRNLPCKGMIRIKNVTPGKTATPTLRYIRYEVIDNNIKLIHISLRKMIADSKLLTSFVIRVTSFPIEISERDDGVSLNDFL